MKPQELRIRNIIEHQQHGLSLVMGIDYDDEICFDYGFTRGLDNPIHGDKVHIKEFKPIPLTEEWLLNFGFKEKRGTYYMKGNGWNWQTYSVSKILGEKNLWVLSKNEVESNDNLDKSFDVCEFSYVHQLQNVYWVANNFQKELEVIQKANT